MGVVDRGFGFWSDLMGRLIDKQVFLLASEKIRENAIRALSSLPLGCSVVFQDTTRSLAQNAALWPALTDISRQIEWAEKVRTPEQWKDIFTGSFFQCEYVPNVDGTGTIALGVRTRTLSKKVFSDLLDYIYAFGALRGVEFRRTSAQAMSFYEDIWRRAA